MSQKRTVLLIDDEVEFHEITRRLLSVEAYQVGCVSSLSEGLSKIKSEKWDCVLLDLSLPDTNGYTEGLTRCLELNNKAVIIVLTALNDRDRGVELIRSGAQDYIPKEVISAEVLSRSIEYAIERKRQFFRIKRQNDQLTRASQEKTNFLARMSHELRTPLSSIIGIAEILKETPLNDQQKQYISMFLNSSNHLLEIINDVLDISKIEAGELPITIQETEIEKTVAEAVDLVAIKCQKGSNDFAFYVCEEIPKKCMTDGYRIKQVLTNLIGNAAKFTRQGEIRVEVEMAQKSESQKMIYFKVTDTGDGIPEEEIENVFQEYKQNGWDVERKHGGTGLGLSISRKIIEKLGGKIWVTSEVGKGSCFQFEVPLEVKEGSKDVKKNLTHLQGKKILIIDDNRFEGDILKKYITQLGGSPYHCLELESAEEQLKKQTFDWVFFDCRMRPLGGFEAFDRINNQFSIAPKTTLMLSAGYRRSDLDEIKKRELNGFLVKPIKRVDVHKTFGLYETKRKAFIETKTAGGETVHRRALLVDDIDENHLIVRNFLKSLPLEIESHMNSRRALEAMKDGVYDILITDIEMPEMSGLELIREVRKIHGHKPYVLVLTAHAMEQKLDEIREAGANEIIVRPLLKKNLQDQILALLEKIQH